MKGSSYIKYFSLTEASSPLFLVLCSKSIPVLCSLIRFPICLCLWIRMNLSQFCVHSSDSLSLSPPLDQNESIPVLCSFIRFLQSISFGSDESIPVLCSLIRFLQSVSFGSDESIPVLCSLIRFPVHLPLWIRMNPSQFCVHSSDFLSLSPLDQNESIPVLCSLITFLQSISFGSNESIPVLCSLIRFPVSPFGSKWIDPHSVFTQTPSVCLLWSEQIQPSSVFTRQIPSICLLLIRTQNYLFPWQSVDWHGWERDDQVMLDSMCLWHLCL